MKSPIDDLLKKIEQKIADLDLYNSRPRGFEARGMASTIVENYSDTLIEAIALKALDPHFDTKSLFRQVVKQFTAFAEVRRGAKLAPEQLDQIVGEAVSELKRSHLKVRPRSRGSEQGR